MSSRHLSYFGKPGFRRASITIGAPKLLWFLTTVLAAAWMSAAGSNRVNVVHRKFTGLTDARSGSSVTTTRGQSANAGSRASLAAAPGSDANDGAPTTRHPAQKT